VTYVLIVTPVPEWGGLGHVFADQRGKGALGPTLGSVSVAAIVSSSRTSRCVVEPHRSANVVTKFDAASSHQKRRAADKQALDSGPGAAWQAGWSSLTNVKPLNLLFPGSSFTTPSFFLSFPSFAFPVKVQERDRKVYYKITTNRGKR
jgi:hypothetical protein